MAKNDYMVRMRLAKAPNGASIMLLFAIARQSLSRNKDDFAGGAGLEDFLVGARGFG
jgi:hypothetical protein